MFTSADRALASFEDQIHFRDVWSVVDDLATYFNPRVRLEWDLLNSNIYKLYSLSVIYKCGYDEILSFFDIHLSDIDRDQMWLTLPHTHLIGAQSSGIASWADISPDMKLDIQFDKTNLVSRMFGKWGGMPVSLLARAGQRNSLYGYVGTRDFTLFPFIRPGSFVEIDSAQKRLNAPVGRANTIAPSISLTFATAMHAHGANLWSVNCSSYRLHSLEVP
jgi:hypothetical protein